MSEKRFLTPEEVAQILDVDVATVRRYIREGLLPALKLKGIYRIEQEDFERFIEERKTGKPTK